MSLSQAPGIDKEEASGENPTLTIVTLAIRQAEHLAGELNKGNL